MKHLRKRSFRLAGHRTSVALEPEFWAALEALAARGGQSMAALVAAVDAARPMPDLPLASALRVHALAQAQAQTQDQAQTQAQAQAQTQVPG